MTVAAAVENARGMEDVWAWQEGGDNTIVEENHAGAKIGGQTPRTPRREVYIKRGAPRRTDQKDARRDQET